jgi:protein O-GlcNAc transferase
LPNTFEEALAALNRGSFIEAERLFRMVLAVDSDHVPSLNLLAVVLMSTDRLQEAESFISRAVKLNCTSDVSFYNYGLIAKRLKKPDLALDLFNQALNLNDKVAETWNNRGTVSNDLENYEAAISDFNRAIGLKPNYAEAYANKDKSLAKLERRDEALAAYDEALALNANMAEAWLGRGHVCSSLKRHDDAFAACQKAITLKPDFVEARLACSNVLIDLKRYDEALAAFDKALALKADLAEAWLGRGHVCAILQHQDDAVAAYNQALKLKPDLAEAWLGLGNLHASANRQVDALAAYDKAITLKPDFVEALTARGNALAYVGRHEAGFSDLDKALGLQPDGPFVDGLRLFAKMHMCDWRNLDAERAHLKLSIENGIPQLPSLLLAVSSCPAEQLRCAKLFNKIEHSSFAHPIWRGERYRHDRIRVAYLSRELRDHAIAYLIAGVFEHHDKSRFEVTGVSFSSGDKSPMQERIKGSLEHFINVQQERDESIARLLRHREVDIAVDLMGFISNNRANVFARRPAPIQLHYLGYPGTMGAGYIDYIVADRIVIPRDHFEFFQEKVVWLPGSYMPYDSRRPAAQGTLSRSDCGLPETAFVFCCFHNSYKISPEVFRCWMSLLKASPNSVLWLSAQGATATANLRREAEAHGVASDLLIFAARVPSQADHLARHQLADLFLDTLPYNAHSTAADALWAGLPVLTRIGQTFAGRVAASLLNAVGLPELIADSEEAYENAALALANDPIKLGEIRRKLEVNRVKTALFNTQLFTRRLEEAYETMYRRHQAGLPPDHFAVAEDALGIPS